MDVFARFRVVAFDLVELAPGLDPSGRSTALAGKLLRECLLASQNAHDHKRGERPQRQT